MSALYSSKTFSHESRVEKLPIPTVVIFLDYLKQERGEALELLSSRLSEHIYQILEQTDTVRNIQLEHVQPSSLADDTRSIDNWLDLCSLVTHLN